MADETTSEPALLVDADTVETERVVIHDHSMAARLEALEEQKAQARNPGSERSVQNHRSKGKMLARERLDYLLDEGSF